MPGAPDWLALKPGDALSMLPGEYVYQLSEDSPRHVPRPRLLADNQSASQSPALRPASTRRDFDLRTFLDLAVATPLPASGSSSPSAETTFSFSSPDPVRANGNSVSPDAASTTPAAADDASNLLSLNRHVSTVSTMSMRTSSTVVDVRVEVEERQGDKPGSNGAVAAAAVPDVRLDDVLDRLPCEVCGKEVSFSSLIEHQEACLVAQRARDEQASLAAAMELQKQDDTRTGSGAAPSSPVVIDVDDHGSQGNVSPSGMIECSWCQSAMSRPALRLHLRRCRGAPGRSDGDDADSAGRKRRRLS